MHQQQTAFENIVGKGEIARHCFLHNQIILFPFLHIFVIVSLYGAESEKPKIGISGKGLTLKLYTTLSRLITTLKEKALENTVGKVENAGNQHFLLFPQCFLLYHSEKLSFQQWLFVVCKCFQFGRVQNFVVW